MYGRKMSLRGWIRELLVERVPPQVPVLQEIVARYRPDVIVSDPMVYQAPIVAHGLYDFLAFLVVAREYRARAAAREQRESAVPTLRCR